MPSPDIVAYREIAQMSGGRLKAPSLRMLASRGQMPPRAHPDYPIWWTQDVEEWLEERGITPKEIPE